MLHSFHDLCCRNCDYNLVEEMLSCVKRSKGRDEVLCKPQIYLWKPTFEATCTFTERRVKWFGISSVMMTSQT